MKRFSAAFAFLFMIFFLTACGPESGSITVVSLSDSPSAAVEYRLLSDEAEPVDLEFTYPLPMSIPDISEEDMVHFDPEKAFDHLLATYSQADDMDNHYYLIDHDYSIENTEVIDGVLYLTISDYRYSYDVNNVYKHLKETFGLSDEDILNLSIFSDCYIYDGYMYADKAAWEERREYDSIEEWKASSEGYVNIMDYDCVTLFRIPVADDALIMPLAEIDEEYGILICSYLLSTQEFIEYLSNADKSDYYFFHGNVYVKYENGYITALEEEFEP
jgi:hypothetical protein